MLTARDVGKIVFWYNGYSDSSYKYVLLQKFIKEKKKKKNCVVFPKKKKS